jgi:hypothetical protein
MTYTVLPKILAEVGETADALTARVGLAMPRREGAELRSGALRCE